jgi:hypothetical protein
MTVLEGKFPMRIIEASATKNSKGNHMIKVKFRIEAGAYAGRTVPNNFNITIDSPNAMKMFFSHMQHLGLDAAYFNTLPQTDAGVAKLAQDLVGRVAEVELGKGSWQGVEREEIKSIGPAPAGMGGSGPSLPTAQMLPTAQGLPVTQPASVSEPVTGSASVDLPMTVGESESDGEPELPF